MPKLTMILVELAATLIAENVNSFDINDLTNQVLSLLRTLAIPRPFAPAPVPATSNGIATGNANSARFYSQR